MKSVDKHTRAEIERVMDDLRALAQEVVAAHQKVEDAVNEHLPALREAAESYNEKVGELNSLYDGIVEEIDGYVEDKSDKWREGDVAQRYEAWKSDLEEKKLEEVEVPDEIEVPCPEVVEPEEMPAFDIKDFS